MAVMLVTGGSRGIGAAVCRLAAEQGWQVVVNYTANRAAAEAVVGSVNAAGSQGVAVQGDVSSEADVAAMYAAAEAMGPVTAVINNALFAGINAGTESRFDLNHDLQVDQEDVDFWLDHVANTRRGDANLDGQVDFVDFLEFSGNFGRTDATWAEGDFNGDRVVDFADYLLLAKDFDIQTR